MRRRRFVADALGVLLGSTVRTWGRPNPLGTLAYLQSDGLWVRDLPDGRPRRLVESAKLASPRFSSTGDWLAFLDRGQVRVASRDGGRAYAVGQGSSASKQPGFSWAAGSDDLLVEDDTGLTIFASRDAWTRPVRALPGASLPAAFRPGGRDMVFGDEIPSRESVRIGRLCRLDSDRPEAPPLVLVSEPSVAQVPCAFAPDGEILFWRDPSFSASFMADGLELFAIPAAGGAARSLGVTTLVHDDTLAVSPDRRTLAVAAGGGRNHWEGKRIALLDLPGKALSYLTEERVCAVSPSWSPDGLRLAYSSAPSPATARGVAGGEGAKRLLSRRRIWTQNVSGGAPSARTADPHYRDEKPLWSADGKHILFCRMDAAEAVTLWLMGAQGDNPRQAAGPLYCDPGPLGAEDTWFGYYGYIDWRARFDWYRG